MKTHIVADGERRLRCSLEFKARLRDLQESIRERHVAELAKAGSLRRLLIRWRMATEYRRQRRKLTPSPGSLYGHR
jgi:hypothetical protein